MDEIIIKRRLLEDLKTHLNQKEISLIVGPRQVGKTTLMLLLKEELEKKGAKTLFLSLDNELDRQHFSSQQSLIRKIQLELGKSKGFVFLDEIQRKENAGIFLKGIYDIGLPYKFIVSGSGSLELKEKIHESLTGRKRIFELNPISFEEFVNSKTNYRYENKLSDYFAIDTANTETFLNEYLQFGGYPRIILEQSLKEKKMLMVEIFSSYLEKDIAYLLNVERRDAFSALIRLLASQTGQMVNYSEIASSVGISVPTLKNYLWYAEKTFVIQLLSPYFTNRRKEIVKSPVVYFCDLGLRNYALGIFGNITNPKEMGLVFQNFVFGIFKEVLKFSSINLHFWRSKDKADVDLVLNLGKEVIPVEIKYKSLLHPDIERSMRSFIEKYNSKKALVVNLSYEHRSKVKDTEIIFLPYWKLFSGIEYVDLVKASHLKNTKIN
jgi:hypothetical protein